MTETEKPYHHGALRHALLEAAERAVRERGVDNLSLRGLARETGVSHGAPRRHFADRQALLDALAEYGFERLSSELSAAVLGAGEAFIGRLRAATAAYVRFAIHDSALLELMFAGKHRDGAAALQEAAERGLSVMLKLIEQGQAQGFLGVGDPERVGLILFSTVHGIAALVIAGMVQPEQLDQLLADSIEHFLRGSRYGC
ncbi:MAG: TetR/AcrR family transcriptional regulator [Actinomycetota bacterium]|nr:TetR/AcrR family transcriptional regulator [Actinomycetota bacterium]MDQ6946317.1 TetR/AcrR family transcriptional regulator [Actinomycetota bacterium]